MKQTKTVRLHIRLTEKEKKEIEKLAKSEGMSVSRFLVSTAYTTYAIPMTIRTSPSPKNIT